MREEKDPITFREGEYDSTSRYSKDFKYAYSIPEDCEVYSLKNECIYLELKGRESMCYELILPSSFFIFDVGSIRCLPYLRKITAYSDFDFASDGCPEFGGVTRYWRGTRLQEICVLPWLVDKYKKLFGYCEGLSEAIVKVTAIPDNIAYQLTIKQDNGFRTSKNGKTLVIVDKNTRILEIPYKIERIAATAFGKENIIEKVVILGDSEDYQKDRSGTFEFDKDAVNSLIHTKTLVFKGPMHTHFYDEFIEKSKIPNLEEVIYPLWNYSHFCFRGSEAENGRHTYEVKAENFSTIELVEEDGIIYTKDGKFLVSGIDCKSKSVQIKKGVEEIFQYAFCCNKDIEEVYIPRSVKKVGSCAFKSCKNIKKIVFNFNQITKDAENAFFTYSREIHFYLPSSDFSYVLKNQYERLHNKFSRQGLGALTEKLTSEDSNIVIVHTLPDYDGEITIDEETGYVYNENGDTFVGILADNAKNLKTITLPNHIRSVSKDAFDVLSLKSIEEIIAPEGIQVIDLYNSAKSCRTLKTIVAGKNRISIEDGVAYHNGYKEIIDVSKSMKIQNFVCKEGVETISSSAFEGHKELVTIQLPQTIKYISDRAFANTGISKITFPASLTRIGKEAFSNCKLSAVIFEGQIADGANAFDYADFDPSAYIKVQKIYKESFISKYPKLKSIVKTPLPKWLSWLE